MTDSQNTNEYSEKINELTETVNDANNTNQLDRNIIKNIYNSNSMSKNSTLLWVEKYRPKKLDDILEQNEIITVLKNTMISGELPHLLLHGPPGSGKTTTILAMARELYGPNLIEDRVIELNASDERGINVVRDTIISFAKRAIGSKDPNFPSPNYKLIILDEADAMTPDAQAALRKVMEKMSAITRFCFICNYNNQIIDPISSRCMKFRFKPVSRDSIFDRLKLIATIEKIAIDNKHMNNCINEIINVSKGDVRRSIMTLQNLKYILTYKKTIELNDITQITGGIELNNFKDFWNKCENGNVMLLRNIASEIRRQGFHAGKILTFINNSLLDDSISQIKNMTDKQKSLIAIELADSDKRLIEGGNEYLQILNIMLLINSIIKKN